jgi:hypothetical protein
MTLTSAIPMETTVNWHTLLQAAIATALQAGPEVLGQHWNGRGADGKLNNAIQILRDAAQIGGTLEQNLAASPAAQAPHPALAATVSATA